MFPGVPNGTEVGQEMDQLYSYLKTIIYRNRDNLYKARNAIAINDTSALGLVDVGHLIFGGEVLLSDGSSIELEPAFDMALDEDHLQRAKEKCGYLPSTRAALKSVKVRHEVVVGTGRSSNDDDDGSVDSNYMADPIAELYESIEDLNRSACMILTNSGYKLASKLQLTLRKVQPNQVQGRQSVLTVANTLQRHDLLMKVVTAGKYFHVTNGGVPMNSNDEALIAHARKEMTATGVKMQKEKDDLREYSVVCQQVEELFLTKPEESWDRRWTNSDLRLVIHWKQGPKPQPPLDHKLSGLLKPSLQALYRDTYSIVEPNHSVWTVEKQAEMDRLLDGDIEDFYQEVGLQRALERDEEELAIRMRRLSSNRRASLISKAFHSLPMPKRQSVADDLALLIDVEEDESIG